MFARLSSAIVGLQPAHDPAAVRLNTRQAGALLRHADPPSHCENYIRSFERLLRAAAACDPDGMIVDAMNGNAQGRLYR